MSQHLSGFADWIEDKTEDLGNLANQVHKEIDKTEIGRYTTRAIGGTIRLASQASEWVNKEAADVERHGMNSVGDIPFWLVGSFNKGQDEAVQRGADFYSDRLNVDPRVYEQIGGPILSAVAEVGAGGAAKTLANAANKLPPPTPRLQTVPVNGTIRLKQDLVPQKGGPVNKLTATEHLAPGVVQDIAKTGKYKAALDKWKTRREYLLNELKNPEKQTTKKQKVVRSQLANDVSTFNPDKEQLGFWGKGPTTKYVNMMREQGAVPGQQAHHLFPKNESYAFIRRMAEVGDDDDLVNMFLYAEMLDAKMGGHIENLLMMDVQPHIGKATTIKGKKLEPGLHLQRQADGREFKNQAAEQMAAFVDEATTADELMAKFDDYLKNNIKSTKKDAIRLQKEFEMASKSVKEEMTQLMPTLSEEQRRRL